MPVFSETHAKLCPLLVAGNLANSDRAMQFEARERHSTSCMEEDCAWWSEDGCAVVAAFSVRLLAGEKT